MVRTCAMGGDGRMRKKLLSSDSIIWIVDKRLRAQSAYGFVIPPVQSDKIRLHARNKMADRYREIVSLLLSFSC